MQISKMTARASALASGGLAAALPLLATAAEVPEYAETANRGLGLPGDGVLVGFATAGGLLVIFAVAALGYLYRRERHLDWDFQKPETPHH